MEPIAKAIALKAELDSLRPLTKEQEAIIMQKIPIGLELQLQESER